MPCACRGRPSTSSFGAAIAILAVQALVEGFVSLQPGVARRDHLISGLLPAAICVLLILVYPRLRAGLRACVALLLGIPALVGASVAAGGVTSGHAALRDLTALLLFPAGVVLIGLGVRLLWRSRKLDRRARRYTRRALLALAGLLVVYWVVLPVSFAVVATHRTRDDVAAVDLGRDYEAVTITTASGLELAAWYVPAQNGAAVITLPRTWSEDQARLLAEHGYGVLLLDPPGYGESDGDVNRFGWGWSESIDAAVAYLAARPDVRDGRVGGLGLSVGGEQMIEAAAANPGLRAVVSEGAGLRSSRESFARRGPSPVELWLQYPFDLTQTAATWLLSGTAPPASLEALAADIAPSAAMFIYGEEGQAAEIALTPVYHDAAGEPRALWEAAGAGHTGALDTQPDEYERRVIDFFDAALLGE